MGHIGKKWTLATRISIFIVFATLLGLLLLWSIVAGLITGIIRKNITNQMTDAVEARAAIINNYVSEAEEYLEAFSLGSEVRALLLD